VKGFQRAVLFVLLALELSACGGGAVGVNPPSPPPLGPIVYNKPSLLGDLDHWSIQPDGTGNAFVPITYRPGVCDQCLLLGAQHPAWSRDGVEDVV
jgi:hypothetical protein